MVPRNKPAKGSSKTPVDTSGLKSRTIQKALPKADLKADADAETSLEAARRNKKIPLRKSQNNEQSGREGTPEAIDTERMALAWTWMQEHRRDLPWRQTRDPWAVLVAELMLQQTQVSRVLQRWPAFLEQYPTFQSAADAGSAAIVTAWSGLGYNRRALALHRCATLVSERSDGTYPRTLDALLALPGIGQYTARAVLAFAYATPAAVVDTNVARVIARAFTGRSLAWSEVQQHADRCVPDDSNAEWVWGWNQGMLDLGATVCTKRSPQCHLCPIQTHCRWQRNGCTGDDPATGSAGVGTKQSRFEGSDRQGRGRLIEALRQGPISFDQLSQAMGWPDDETRAHRVAETLLADGLVVSSEITHEFTLA